jgi:hypothetical protein
MQRSYGISWKLVLVKVLDKQVASLKELCHIRMDDGDSMKKHLNSFNTLVIQFVYVDIKMEE